MSIQCLIPHTFVHFIQSLISNPQIIATPIKVRYKVIRLLEPLKQLRLDLLQRIRTHFPIMLILKVFLPGPSINLLYQ